MRFFVQNVRYEIADKLIEDFPIKDVLINVLFKYYKEKNIGVEIQDGCIVIRTEYKNFDKIVKIYKNPYITMTELLDVKKQFLIYEKYVPHKFSPLLYENGYKEFKKELKYYGLWPLFALHGEKMVTLCNSETEKRDSYLIHKEKRDIDIQEIQKRIHKNIQKKFGNVKDFMNNLRMLGGCLSGSFILSSVLNEEWDYKNTYKNWSEEERNKLFKDCGEQLNKTIDIDIYVNKYILEGVLKQIGKIETTGLRELWDIAKSVRKMFDFDEKYEIMDPEKWKETYGETGHMCYMIYFSKCGIKIDFIVLDCTVPYFIASFDFDFNTVYYDGFTVSAFNWKSILSRRSNNYKENDKHDISENVKYFNNRARILKYFERGFVITIKNTSDYKSNYYRRTEELDEDKEEHTYGKIHLDFYPSGGYIGVDIQD